MVLDNGRYISSELGNITKMLEEHFRVALTANRIISGALIDWLNEGKSMEKEDLTKITHLEEQGDDLKRQILRELANANSLLQREDLLRLVHYNDKLVDGAEIACYHLAAVQHSGWTPDGELREKVSRLGELVINQITEQREAVRFLSINMENSMKRANQICILEKQIDIIQREIMSLLYNSDIEIAILLRFRDFLNMMEDISNLSEDAAITIRSLSLTLNT